MLIIIMLLIILSYELEVYYVGLGECSFCKKKGLETWLCYGSGKKKGLETWLCYGSGKNLKICRECIFRPRVRIFLKLKILKNWIEGRITR